MPTSRRDLLKAGVAALATGWLPSRAWGAEPAGGTLYVSTSFGQERRCSVMAVDVEAGTWSVVATIPRPSGRVSPDGRRLAYSYSRGGEEPEAEGVWAVDLTGRRGPRRVTGRAGAVFWLPDGASLIVSSAEAGGTSEPPVRRVRVDEEGSEPAGLPTRWIVEDVSPDGRWFLVSDREARTLSSARPVYAVRPDGSDARLLTRGRGDSSEEDGFVARWLHRFSADGAGAFYFVADGPWCNVWHVGLDGQGERLVIPERPGDAPFQVVPAPDGRRLAVLRFDRSVGEDGRKNDAITGRHVEIFDLKTGRSTPVAVPPSEGLWLMDWR